MDVEAEGTHYNPLDHFHNVVHFGTGNNDENTYNVVQRRAGLVLQKQNTRKNISTLIDYKLI